MEAVLKFVKKALDAGFTSVMIDASHYPLAQNIAITKEVVEYAKKKQTPLLKLN